MACSSTMPRTSTVERAFWEKRIASFRKSELTANAFAERIGVNVHTLKKWKWKLDSEAKAGGPRKSAKAAKRSAPSASFVEIMPAFSQPIEIVIGETTIRIDAGFDDETLRRAVVVLQGALR